MADWALSLDLRERVVAAYEEGGLSQKAVAERFSISQSTVSLWLRHKRERGTLEPAKPPGKTPTLTAEDEAFLAECLERRSDLTQEELADELAERGVHVSRFAVGRALRRMGWTRKKNDVRG